MAKENVVGFYDFYVISHVYVMMSSCIEVINAMTAFRMLFLIHS